MGLRTVWPRLRWKTSPVSRRILIAISYLNALVADAPTVSGDSPRPSAPSSLTAFPLSRFVAQRPAGLAQEHVVQRRSRQRDGLQGEAATVEQAEDPGHGGLAALDIEAQGALVERGLAD